MVWIVIAFIVLLAIAQVRADNEKNAKRNSGAKGKQTQEPKQPKPFGPSNHPTWMREKLKLLESADPELVRKLVPGWHFNKPTERQLEMLRDRGIDPSLIKSKGEASDYIGSAYLIDEDDAAVISFFGKNPSGMSQSEGRFAAALLLAHGDNQKLYDAKSEGGNKRVEGKREKDVSEWESELHSVWSGDPLAVTFTYHGHRRQVQVREILHHPSGHVFILGHCSYRDEDRYFDLAKLDTMILMKSKRYDAYDWLIRVLGEDAVMGMEVVL